MLNRLHDLYNSIFAQLLERKYRFSSIIFLGSSILMMCLSLLLIYEYSALRYQTEKMLQTREDYQNYVVAVKKILHDYYKNKERLEELESVLEEKKKLNEDEASLVSVSQFPDGVRVYSTDDEETDEFLSLTVNRELDHLKQSSTAYYKEQKMNAVAQKLDPYMWLEYTDAFELERSKAERKQSQKKRLKNRRYATRSHHQYKISNRGKINAQKYQDISLAWPIDRSSFWLSSFFGPRRKPNGLWGFHYGVDMAAVRGTQVCAAASGVVVEAQYSSGYGKTIVIAHNHKYRTRYAHLNTILVQVGQKVDQGKCIGKVGATGFVRSKRGGDASHLHFEVYVFGKQVNPMYFF